MRHHPAGPLMANAVAFCAEYLPVAPGRAAAEHHVGDHDAAPGAQPPCRLGGQRPLVLVPQVVQRVTGHDQIDAGRRQLEGPQVRHLGPDVAQSGLRGPRGQGLRHDGEISTASTEPASGASASATNPVPAPRSTQASAGPGSAMASSRSSTLSNPLVEVTCVCQLATRLSHIRASDKTHPFQVSCKLRGETLGRRSSWHGEFLHSRRFWERPMKYR